MRTLLLLVVSLINFVSLAMIILQANSSLAIVYLGSLMTLIGLQIIETLNQRRK